jgi:translation initiation factor 3 subunit K
MGHCVNTCHVSKDANNHFSFVFTDQTLKHWVKKYGWKEEDSGMIFIANQDENIKTKNITEKIDFESAAAIMAASR